MFSYSVSVWHCLGSLFLEQKAVCYDDIDRFWFFILFARNKAVGFFSREKLSWENNTLACILVYPPHQRQGHGDFLISLSNELARRDNRPASPEKPLSDFGYARFLAYWQAQLVNALNLKRNSKANVITQTHDAPKISTLTLKELVRRTGLTHEDVSSALLKMDIIDARRRRDGAFMIPRTRISKVVQQRKTTTRVCTQARRIAIDKKEYCNKGVKCK